MMLDPGTQSHPKNHPCPDWCRAASNWSIRRSSCRVAKDRRGRRTWRLPCLRPRPRCRGSRASRLRAAWRRIATYSRRLRCGGWCRWCRWPRRLRCRRRGCRGGRLWWWSFGVPRGQRLWRRMSCRVRLLSLCACTHRVARERARVRAATARWEGLMGTALDS